MTHLRFAAAFALLTTPAFAQDTLALAEQYTNMPEVQRMISSMFAPEALGQQVAASLPPNVTLSPDQQSRIGLVMAEAMNDLRPRMEQLMITGSAQTFSADELQALIDFYGSEHGATIMTKMQPFMATVMGQLAPEMQAMQAKIGPQIVEILQEQ